MRFTIIAGFVALLLIAAVGAQAASEQEQDAINKFFKGVERKHTHKLGFLSFYGMVNRVNRDNDYNRFANYSSSRFTNADIPWLGQAKAMGLDMGIMLWDRVAWSVGGEYWLKMGSSTSGSYEYLATAESDPIDVTDLDSEIKVWGISTGVDYYLTNEPKPISHLEKLAFRIGGKVGFYQVNWNVWQDYANLNVEQSLSLGTATSDPSGANTAFKGSSPGFSIHVGADYPLGFYNMVLGGDFGYTHLNFANVAWYNSSNEEVIATWDGTADARVDLDLSGVQGRIHLKRFISW
jgi:hypothetical protein